MERRFPLHSNMEYWKKQEASSTIVVFVLQMFTYQWAVASSTFGSTHLVKKGFWKSFMLFNVHGSISLSLSSWKPHWDVMGKSYKTATKVAQGPQPAGPTTHTWWLLCPASPFVSIDRTQVDLSTKRVLACNVCTFFFPVEFYCPTNRHPGEAISL